MREKVFSEGKENVMISERFEPAEALDADCPYLFNCKVRNQLLLINFSRSGHSDYKKDCKHSLF